MIWIIVSIVIVVVIIIMIIGLNSNDPNSLKFSDIVRRLEEDQEVHTSTYNPTFIGSYKDEDQITSDDLEDIIFNLEEYSEGDTWLNLPVRGINHRKLTKLNIGTFDGYIMPDKENKYDKYAIGIYGNDGTHFGFIEKGQKDLYQKINQGDGYINVVIETKIFTPDNSDEGKFYGIVSINKADIL